LSDKILVCPRCAAKADPADRFCRQCGYNLVKQEGVGEHKFITVLFSDLSGYTAMSEVVDPEELKDIMYKIFGRASEIIAQYGGIVEKFIGDAVVALFGVYRMHEDNPIRAIRVALEIHKGVDLMSEDIERTYNIPLRMHTGINAGVVLIEEAGSSSFSQGALGTPINIASRLSQMAPPGEILIGESIFPEAKRYFDLGDIGMRRVKGIKDALHVYKVISERVTPLAIHREGGLVSAMIGREKEIAILKEKGAGLKQDIGSVICIRGNPGVGKSRLIEEFRKSLVGSAVTWYDARCFDYAKDIPYLPVAEMVKQILGIKDKISIQKKSPLVKQKIKDITGTEAIYPYLAVFCGLDTKIEDTGPEVLKAGLFEAVFLLISKIAHHHPIVICIEDIQWADQSSIDLLRFLLSDNQGSYPCLYILSYRGESGFPLPGHEIQLRDLSLGQAGNMIRSLLETQNVKKEVIGFIYEKAGGNPFYLEEVLNYLIEKGVIIDSKTGASAATNIKTYGIPLTVKGVIASRLDSLDQGCKEILHEGAVIGRIFSKDLLREITHNPEEMDRHLDTLVRLGLLRIIQQGSGEYAFRHALTRDVAYESMLKRDRRSLHKKVAHALEDASSDEKEEMCEKIAYHFGLSGDQPNAIMYNIMAAKKNRSSGSLFEAANHYMTAEACLKEYIDYPMRDEELIDVWEGIWACTRIFNPEKSIHALERLAERYKERREKDNEAFSKVRLINTYSQKGLFEKAIDTFHSISDLVKEDPLMRAAASTAVAYTYTYLGKPNIALKYLGEARPLFSDDHKFFLGVNYITTLTAMVWKGDISGALFWYKKTRDMYGGESDIDLLLLADIWLGYIYYLMGRSAKAKEIFTRCSKTEQMLGALAGGVSYIRIQSAIYFYSRYMGDITGARAELDRFTELSKNFHIEGVEALIALYKGWILEEEGHLDQARELFEYAIPVLKKGIANRLPYALNAFGEVCLHTRDFSCARLMADQGIEWNLENGNNDQLIWAYRLMGNVCVEQGLYEKAGDNLSKALSLSIKFNMLPNTAWTLASWGVFWKKKGDDKMANIFYKKAISMWQAMNNPYQMAKAKGGQSISAKG